MTDETNKSVVNAGKYTENDEGIEELILIDHQLTQTEHKTIVQALKAFINTALVPMTTKPTKIAINALKKQKEIAQSLLTSMYAFSDDIVVSNQEFSILKRALNIFMHLPKPLWQNPEEIKAMKDYQDTAAQLLGTLKLEDNDALE